MDARVVVTFSPDEAQRDAITGRLAPLGGAAYLGDAADDGERAALLGGAEALFSWFPRRELGPVDWPALTGVRLIQLLSAGANQVDFGMLPDGVIVASNVGAYAGPMAEHALGMAVALAKRLPRNHARLASGVFDMAPTVRLDGGVAAILGFGGIGRACARLLRPLGMRIYAVNTSGRTSELADFAGTLADLEQVLSAADVAIVALPLTRATRGLIGARELGWMKPQAVLVNVARGAIVDEDALFEHLKSHPGFSAGIDAWWEEPGNGKPFHPRLPFLDLPNVLGSPHNSGIVPGAMAGAAAAAAANLAAFLRGEAIHGIQDPADY